MQTSRNWIRIRDRNEWRSAVQEKEVAIADGACVKTCQQCSKLQQKKDAESFKLTSVKRVYSGLFG